MNWVPVRLELESKTIPRLNLPGIPLQLDVAILGHEAASLYVCIGDTLLAIQSP